MERKPCSPQLAKSFTLIAGCAGFTWENGLNSIEKWWHRNVWERCMNDDERKASSPLPLVDPDVKPPRLMELYQHRCVPKPELISTEGVVVVGVLNEIKSIKSITSHFGVKTKQTPFVRWRGEIVWFFHDDVKWRVLKTNLGRIKNM